MNKEQLEKLSDFEIDAKISMVIDDGYFYFVNRKEECVFKNDFSGIIPISDRVSFCNDYDIMMPLAFESGISLVNDGDSYLAHPTVEHWASGGESGRFDYECDYAVRGEPSRAAAIVYLLMQGEE